MNKGKDRMSAKEYRQTEQKKPSKYHNIKTEVDGILFDSKAESFRYKDLKLMEEAGLISDLKLQPVYELIPSFIRNGRKQRATTYRADFSYVEKGETIVEDVKGKATEVFCIKWKLFNYIYPLMTLRVNWVNHKKYKDSKEV